MIIIVLNTDYSIVPNMKKNPFLGSVKKINFCNGYCIIDQKVLKLTHYENQP